jgi:plasmid stability protein
MAMAALYFGNVPDDPHEALRERAHAGHRSMAAEVVALHEQNIPTEGELRARSRIMRKLNQIRLGKKSGRRFPSTEEMQRQDRKR